MASRSWFPFLERRNRFQGLTRLHVRPVCQKFSAMLQCPLPDSLTGLARIDSANKELTVKRELRLLVAVFGVEMWRLVILIEHADNDPKEYRDNRHASSLQNQLVLAGVACGNSVSRQER
jgi:hypothetical protein